MTTTTLERPRIATPAEWLAARKALLKKEKELTHLRESLAAERRALPWVRVEKNYVFEAPGLSCFAKDESGTVFHSYSSFGRGVEDILPVYAFLDRAPKGRNEAGLPFSMAWVRHHDRYADGYLADADRPYWPAFEAQDPAPAKRSAAAKADSSCCHGENH